MHVIKLVSLSLFVCTSVGTLHFWIKSGSSLLKNGLHGSWFKAPVTYEGIITGATEKSSPSSNTQPVVQCSATFPQALNWSFLYYFPSVSFFSCFCFSLFCIVKSSSSAFCVSVSASFEDIMIEVWVHSLNLFNNHLFS